MRVGIVGSRKRKDRQSVVDLVNNLSDGTVVISGGCYGVDTWAAEAARNRGLKVIEHFAEQLPKGLPHWEYTKANYARNLKIAQDCETLYAFVSPDRKGGTENTIKHAKKLGKMVVVIELNNKLQNKEK